VIAIIWKTMSFHGQLYQSLTAKSTLLMVSVHFLEKQRHFVSL